MSKDTDTCFLENLEGGAGGKKSLVQRYLQNPFSLPWSKLAALFRAASATSRAGVADNTQYVQSKQYRFNPIHAGDLYPYFDVQTEYLILDTNLQEFAQKVSYVCAFHTGGKLSTEQAYAKLDQLWNEFVVKRSISK